MAKSLFEPKKIPTYTENLLKPNTGLQAAPVPVRQQSATKAVPKTQAIPVSAQQVSAPAPAPVAPPAPVPASPPAPASETRAFSFDGATELTASFNNSKGNLTWTNALHGTFTPGWDSTDTGSFAVFSIGTPDSDDYRFSIYFQRTSGSTGYHDYIVTEATSGSNYNRGTYELIDSPNFYSGSVENVYLQIYGLFGADTWVYQNGGPTQSSRLTNSSNYTNRSQRAGLANKPWSPDTHTVSIGGFNSGSDSYYKGQIDHLAFFKKGYNYGTGTQKKMPNFTNNDSVAWYWKFEGNTVATKGPDLTVVGTETYVSSSI